MPCGGRSAPLGPDQVGDQATSFNVWEVRGFLVAQQCPCQAQQPPVPAWRSLCWHLNRRAKAKREKRRRYCAWVGRGSKDPPPPPPPLHPSKVSGECQRGIVSARVSVFVCTSSTKARPHRWKGGCACVCVCVCCVVLGLRESHETDPAPTHLPASSVRGVRAPAAGEESHYLAPPPRTSPPAVGIR